MDKAERAERLKWLLGFQPGDNPLGKALELIIWIFIMIGGPIVGVWALDRFSPLHGQATFVLLGLVGAWFMVWLLAAKRFSCFRAVNFLGKTASSMGLSTWMRRIAGLGVSLALAFLTFGLLLWANAAMDRTSETRLVPWTRKDSGRYGRTAWVELSPGVVASIPMTVAAYPRLTKGTAIRLTTGRGALGIAWVRQAEPIDPNAQVERVTSW